MGQRGSREAAAGAPQYTESALAGLANDELYARGEAVRIVVMSDTHNAVRTAEDAARVPAGDIFIHCGDVTVDGTAAEARAFNDWLGHLPHKHRIVIAGNHDLIFDPLSYHANVAQSSKKRRAAHQAPGDGDDGDNGNGVGTADGDAWAAQPLPDEATDAAGRAAAVEQWRRRVREDLLSNATLYIEEELVTLTVPIQRRDGSSSEEGTQQQQQRTVQVVLAGAPQTDVIAISSARAFAVDEARQTVAFSRCLHHGPLDVLITHGPPNGILDTFLGARTGSNALARAVADHSQAAPTLHLFGHVHKQRGVQTGAELTATDGSTVQVNTTFVNAASVVGLKHRIRDQPTVVIDLPVDQLVASRTTTK